MPAMEARRAGKNHKCDQCRKLIKQGTIYLLYVILPTDDFSVYRIPEQLHICTRCTETNPRGTELLQRRRRLERNKAQARYLKRKKVAAA